VSSKIVFYTDHYINRTITQFLSKSQNLKLDRIDNFKKYNKVLACSYGILRGASEIFDKSENFIYIDHGYFNSSKRQFTKNKKTLISNLSGYFRIVRNDLYFNKDYKNENKFRFNSLGIELKDLNKNGEIIIVSEPSEFILKFLKIPDWTKETVAILKKHTDRRLIIHNKFSEIPLKSLMKNAYAFVSCQSTAGYMAITEGVPAYFTHESLKGYGKIQDIENRKLNHSLLFSAANSQYRLSEFFSNDFYEYFNNIAS